MQSRVSTPVSEFWKKTRADSSINETNMSHDRLNVNDIGECTDPKTGRVYFARIRVSSHSRFDAGSLSGVCSLTSSGMRGTRGERRGVFSFAFR